MSSPFLLVIFSSLMAALGQIAFKMGAANATSWVDYINVRLLAGFALYGGSTVLWVIALSKLPLSRVYPFTILTFVLVYVASFVILGEPVTPKALVGAALVLAGLVVIVFA